jgi:uncharacterized protein YegP (UPF0339 family)
MSAEFVLQQDKDGRFFFVFQTETGQMLLTSGSYFDPDVALRRLQSAHKMARKDRNYELREFCTGDEVRFFFVVKNRSKEVLAHSQMYPDPESRRQGMSLTRGCSHGARIENPFKELIRAQRAEQLRELIRTHSSYTLETPFGCPECGSAMVPKISRKGPHEGEKFWGCSNYPWCRGFLEYDLVPEPEPQTGTYTSAQNNNNALTEKKEAAEGPVRS